MEYIKIPKVSNVRLLDLHSRKGTVGTLYLTATHLIFHDHQQSDEKWILHSHIHHVEKLNLVQQGSPLRIKCKNFEVMNFIVEQERDCHDLYSSLKKLSKPVKLTDLYAFSYNPREQQLRQDEGWKVFDVRKDFEQMGLPTLHWKISNINKDFGLCETYPPIICVPSSASSSLLMGSAQFRSKKRLPVLSYKHTNGAVVVRCSQPMSGLKSRSIPDESYLELIRNSKPDKNNFMYIVDTRPMINAIANRAQGKGYENLENYQNIKYKFLGIDNIHVMRSSLNKLLEVCRNTSCTASEWLEGLNSSGWLKHVFSVLQVSRFIANAVGIEERSVLVHCSDGWDRTAQVCSLASIILQPRYRTIVGFLTLIQREWLEFGHKFSHRSGHLERGDSRETSPIFTQFLDCVHQLMTSHPSSFQFNDFMLIELNDHVTSCQFGTFLCNCAKERIDNKLHERTYSLWGYMLKRSHLYTNPFYSNSQQNNEDLLEVPTYPQSVHFWLPMYNRSTSKLLPRSDLSTPMQEMNNQAAVLEGKVTRLKKEKRRLEREKNGGKNSNGGSSENVGSSSNGSSLLDVKIEEPQKNQIPDENSLDDGKFEKKKISLDANFDALSLNIDENFFGASSP